MSDRVGRRPVAIGSSAALVVLAIPTTVVASRGSLVGLALAQVLIGIAVAGVLSVAMLGEAFPTPVRSTGVALTAGIATALVGGTAPWIAQILVSVTAVEAAPGVYVSVIGSSALVALWRWPETAFRNLSVGPRSVRCPLDPAEQVGRRCTHRGRSSPVLHDDSRSFGVGRSWCWESPRCGHRLEEGYDMSNLLTYADGEPFSGVIGRTSDESSPAWPTPPRAPEGAPNVVMFVLDDVGFGQLSSFGGLVETPVLDRFADNGLRYTNMHTTALCSPSRGAILTGRNHHSLGLATISETSTGYPGYNAILPFDKGMLSEMLLPHGYNTFMVGKWHLAPPEHETPAGPYDRWPLGRGFERFYGFLGGDTNQWYPELVYDNHSIEQPAQPEDGYHLSATWPTGRSSSSRTPTSTRRTSRSTCTTAPAPPTRHTMSRRSGPTSTRASSTAAGTSTARSSTSASSRWASSRPVPSCRPTTRMSPSGRRCRRMLGRLYARMMEVYAGFVSYTDHEFGRVVELPGGDRRARQHVVRPHLRQRREL